MKSSKIRGVMADIADSSAAAAQDRDGVRGILSGGMNTVIHE